jgi:hypothetical protein
MFDLAYLYLAQNFNRKTWIVFNLGSETNLKNKNVDLAGISGILLRSTSSAHATAWPLSHFLFSYALNSLEISLSYLSYP